MANNILVRDAQGSLIVMKTLDQSGVHVPYQMVGSVEKKFRDSFTGATLDLDKWEIIATGGGIAVSAGNLVLTSGVVANGQTAILSKETFAVPFRISFNLQLSQRIANQSFIVEAVSVDPVTGIPDGLSSCAWVFDGTNAVRGKYRVQNGGVTPLDSGSVVTVTSSDGTGFFEIEPFADESWFHCGVLDSSAGRSNSYRRHQQIPDPNSIYKIQLRWLNGATAPASSTNATMQFVAVQDYQELTAEITAGRGQTSAGQSMAVAVVSAPTTSVTGTVTANAISQDNAFFNDSTTNLAASATFTGTTRDVGVAAAAAHRYRSFQAFSFSNVAGSMHIEISNDGTTWFRATAITAVAANTPVFLSVAIVTRFHRVVYTNGASAQTSFLINSSFSS